MVSNDVGDGRSIDRGTDLTHDSGRARRLGRKTSARAPRRGRVILAIVCAAAFAGLGASWASTGAASAAKSAAAGSGGSLTVLLNQGYEGAWPSGLDPATNTNGGANQDLMNSIFGNLFELGPKGKIIPDLAKGYTFQDGGKTVTINLRSGLTFSNGDPLNAQVVAANITRDYASSCTCSPKSIGWPPLAPAGVTTAGPTVVQLHFSAPYAAIIHSFIDSDANWIADLSVEQSQGESTFQNMPVGAGPFEVVSDTLSQQLVLKANPRYWQAGHPLLASLTFKTVANDEAGYEAMLAGQGQVYVDASTPQIEAQAAKKFSVVQQASTSPYDLQFNTSIPPLNSEQARLALYYATNTQAIVQHLFGGKYPLTQSFTSPGGLYYVPKVPGYPGYNLAKAKAIVKKLGGLTVNLGTIAVPVAEETILALASQWKQAGIQTTTANYTLLPLIGQFVGGKWQAMLQTAGSWDPAAGVGVAFRFGSHSAFSGVHSATLDSLLTQAASTFDDRARLTFYKQAAAYIAKNADGPFLFSWAPDQIFAKNVTGPGLTTPIPAVIVSAATLWEDVTIK